jgi:hypothetical protein
MVQHDPLGGMALGGSAITVGGVGLAAWIASREPGAAPIAPPAPTSEEADEPPAALSA